MRPLRTSHSTLRSAVLAALIALPFEAAAEDVRVVIESPRPGERVENKVDQAPLQGMAIAKGEQPSDFDVMIVMDVSKSTTAASGVDVDGDGEVGVDPELELLPPVAYPPGTRNTDPGDSILHAEAMAARALVKGLDPRRVRVGLITFAGEVDPTTGERRSPTQQNAWVEVPLTGDVAQVSNAIEAVLARGASGATDFAAGVRLGVRELAGLSGARSNPRANAKKVMLFLTDGVPSLPIGKGDYTDEGDNEAAVGAAQLARSAGIAINSYALGPNALSQPFAVTEIARTTLGTFTPVMNPGDIVALLQGVSFANIEDVVLSNLTTGELSTDVRLNPDGSFNGYVPVRIGKNRIRVTALASDGGRGSATVEIEFGRSQLSQREMSLELERIRRMNKELLLLRERQRIDEFRNREKKELEIEVEKTN
ncbi:MAG: VWA domain-containing protein [Myxococcota bacterium]|nr:VWA domain-containing protein [Myxococcota bacterium]